jgi:hypothetical protein
MYFANKKQEKKFRQQLIISSMRKRRWRMRKRYHWCRHCTRRVTTRPFPIVRGLTSFTSLGSSVSDETWRVYYNWCCVHCSLPILASPVFPLKHFKRRSR